MPGRKNRRPCCGQDAMASWTPTIWLRSWIAWGAERRELTNRLKVLLAHLLKWRYQPKLRGRSWEATVKEQRLSIQDLLDDNPSLRGTLDSQIAKAYRLARLLAVKETNLEESHFPEVCPFTLEQVMDEGFYPL